MQALVDLLQVLPVKEREVMEVAGQADDDGTADLITPLIAGQEKKRVDAAGMARVKNK